MADFIKYLPNPFSLSGIIQRLGWIAAAFEKFYRVPARRSTEIGPVLLGDMEPEKKVLGQSTLCTEKDVLMPHATQVLLLARLVRLAVIEYKYPTKARLGPFVGKLQNEHIGELSRPPQLTA